MKELTISEVAKRAGIRASAIRYYESIQLLPPPQRSAGRRRYTPDVLRTAFVQLRFSPTCGTNWGRVISRVGLAHLFVRIDRIDGLSFFSSISTGVLVFSPMVFAPVVKARACGTVKGVSGCTAFV